MRYIKNIMLFAIVYTLLFLTTFFSMKEYSSDVSASCVDCSYLRDVLIFSFFSSIIIMILFFFVKKVVKRKQLISIVVIITFLISVLINNYNIFVDRVSAWSSFSFEGELMGVISSSYLYTIISVILLWFFIKKIKLADNI
ncbi:hypothetical protein QWZ06_20770 [Chryseobacterium tructae]|uniref:Uncharacterized protein n=1 Tax=Chryseobacterium tructae TaxID=1037380 RepID=A0ABV7Y2R8_9FLAO|nr:hypothetical protein [Chryseobacterium tructae]MDN3694524.1 hypothetical protein [Chryseobacterium tructae]